MAIRFEQDNGTFVPSPHAMIGTKFVQVRTITRIQSEFDNVFLKTQT